MPGTDRRQDSTEGGQLHASVSLAVGDSVKRPSLRPGEGQCVEKGEEVVWGVDDALTGWVTKGSCVARRRQPCIYDTTIRREQHTGDVIFRRCDLCAL